MEDVNKLEQESDNIEKSESETTSESNTEAVDSAISKTEEKNELAEDSVEAVVKDEKSESEEASSETAEKEEKSELADIKGEEEAKEAEIVEEDKDSEEKEYAEISEETKTAEEITEEAESENTEADVVADDINKSEDNKEAVEPEIEEVEKASDEAVEDADITETESHNDVIEGVAEEKEPSEHSLKEETTDVNNRVEEIIIIEETQVVSEQSSKPKAVLDELDRLKTVKPETEAAEVKEVKKVEDKEPEKVSAEVSAEAEKSSASEETKSESVDAEPHSDSDDSSEEFNFKRVFNKDFWKSFLFDIFFLALCVWFTFVLIQKWFSTREVIIQGTNQIHGSLESGEKTTIGNINILVMGIDSVEGTHRSDTIFVLGVNPSKKKIMMLSIPRDTRVIIEDKGRKINEILPRYGEATLRMILEDLLKISISRKVEIGFESFIGVIDAIGGVDINIEKPMHYDDNWGNLHIHFNPGMNHLNGQDALRYVRFRKDAMADLGRIKRQQDFVKAVVKKVFSPAIIVRLPSIIETAFKYIKTDFTLQEIMTLAKGFDGFDVKFSTLSLPGEARYIDKISFFVPYSEEAVSIGNNYFSDLAIFELEKDYDFGKVIPKQSKPNRKK